MVSRRPEAGSALGRGQSLGSSKSHHTSVLGQGVGTVVSSPRTRAGVSTPPHTVPLSLLSDRTLACRCSTTCRQTLSFWLAGWHCWRLSSGQVTLRHPHPLLCWPSLTFMPTSRKCWLGITCFWIAECWSTLWNVFLCMNYFGCVDSIVCWQHTFLKGPKILFTQLLTVRDLLLHQHSVTIC